MSEKNFKAEDIKEIFLHIKQLMAEKEEIDNIKHEEMQLFGSFAKYFGDKLISMLGFNLAGTPHL